MRSIGTAFDDREAARMVVPRELRKEGGVTGPTSHLSEWREAIPGAADSWWVSVAMPHRPVPSADRYLTAPHITQLARRLSFVELPCPRSGTSTAQGKKGRTNRHAT